MPSISVENYLKAIYHLQRRTSERVKTKDLAARLDISLPSATSMMKSLAAGGLVEYQPYRGVLLTARGEKSALRVIRIHRLIEVFLVQALGYDWDEVHEEAELLEHAVSDKLADRIDTWLGYPRVDPHGDPIPTRDGRLEQPDGTPLHALPEDTSFRVVRVLSQEPAILRYLDQHGLRPGSTAHLESREPFDGPLLIRSGERLSPIGRTLGRILVVEAAELP